MPEEQPGMIHHSTQDDYACYPVVISSCDAYRDAWSPFATLFSRYWPDCPFPVYLITNDLPFAHSGFHTFRIGVDRGWASNIARALQSLECEWFIYLQEDYFLTETVDTARVLRLLGKAIAERAACLRLFPAPGPDKPSSALPEIGEITEDAAYRVSLQAAIWQKSAFESILVAGENAWDMEIKGTERSRQMKLPFLSVSTLENPAISYLPRTAILKGCWTREAIALCEREGIPLDTSHRPIFSQQKRISAFTQRMIRKSRRFLSKLRSQDRHPGTT